MGSLMSPRRMLFAPDALASPPTVAMCNCPPGSTLPSTHHSTPLHAPTPTPFPTPASHPIPAAAELELSCINGPGPTRITAPERLHLQAALLTARAPLPVRILVVLVMPSRHDNLMVYGLQRAFPGNECPEHERSVRALHNLALGHPTCIWRRQTDQGRLCVPQINMISLKEDIRFHDRGRPFLQLEHCLRIIDFAS
ncbi:hypothetical protein BDW72DRAFT_81155 [Aspergillus terricola var. indicus]